MLNHARHLCAPGGRFLAMKGVYPEEELAAIPADFAVSEVVALKVPGLDAARHLAILTLRS
jgi:16S rRNA (guanine527-N7)-methyltransferase